MSGVNYGPLKALIGTWRGDKGVDVAPSPDGSEDISYFETITFEAIGDVTNARAQTLAVLRYHQVVRKQDNGEIFHDQCGYWGWDAATGVVTHSLLVPRGVGVVAEGSAKETDGSVSIEVATGEHGIAESAFMREKASSTAFSQKISIAGDELSYSQTTMLEIYGKSFAHSEENRLKRES
jgi:hypothetical protein